MLKLVDSSALQNYLENDWVGQALVDAPEAIKELQFTGDRWMKESAPKRMIYASLYGDLLRPVSKKTNLLDIGGGFCGLSNNLVSSTSYTLVDICAHESSLQIEFIRKLLGENGFIAKDWNEFLSQSRDHYDVIIANDLFPNVDQRLDLFLKKALPRCKELRLSLTFYNEPRFYQVKRIDGDEVFWYLAWSFPLLKTLLEPYCERMSAKLDFSIADMPTSLYPNGRQVVLVSLKGDL